MAQQWLARVAAISILAGMASAVWIAVDEYGRPQPMWTMNLVWPLVGLSGFVIVL